MRVGRLIFPFVLFFSFLIPSAAQQTASSSPQAVQYLQRALAALNGSTLVSDVTLSGSARRIAGSDDETGTATYKALSTGAARFDCSYHSGLRSEVREDFVAGPLGAWSGPDGVSHAMAFHNLKNHSSIFPAFVLANLNPAQNFLVTFISQETKAGHLVYHLSAVQQFPQMRPKRAALEEHLTQIDVFLDAATFLPVALDFNTHPDDDAGLDIPIELLFSDYRTVSGVQIPFHVQKFLNNGLILDLQIQNAAINSGLSANQFAAQVR